MLPAIQTKASLLCLETAPAYSSTTLFRMQCKSHTPKEKQAAHATASSSCSSLLLSEFQNHSLLEGRRLSFGFFVCFFHYLWVVCKNWSWVKTTVKEQKTPKKGKAGCEVYLTEASGSVHLPTRFVSPSRQDQKDSWINWIYKST